MTNIANLNERLVNETKAGTINLTRPTTVPQVPRATIEPVSLQKSVDALTTIVNTREGLTGSVLDKHLTLRDLMDAGVFGVKIGQLQVGGRQAGSNGFDPTQIGAIPVGYNDPRPVFVIPPALTNLQAQGAFRDIVLTWNMVDFQNFSYTEVWRASTNALGSATIVGTSTATIYDDASGTVGASYYYWVRAVSIENAKGPFNAVGGTLGALLVIGGTDLGPLVVTADKLSQGTFPNINLVMNPGSEDGILSWTAQQIVGTPTFTATSADKTGGSTSFLSHKNSLTEDNRIASTAFAVIPGETYSVKVKTRSSVASAAGLYIRMYEQASKPTLPATSTLNTASSTTDMASNAASTLGWSANEYTYVVPAGVYWVSLGFIHYSTSSALDLYWDDCSVGRQITASFLAANSIAVGTLAVQNGALVNAMIANLAVDNAKIANLDGAKINANTITAAQITAATITATQIASATILGGNIAANTVAAGNINSNGLSIRDTSGNVILAAGNALDFNTRMLIANTPGVPANNASADISLTNRGNMTITGNAATKTSGSSAYDGALQSISSITGGCYVEFTPTQTSAAFAVGLSTAPTGTNYATLNYCWYVAPSSVGFANIYELGAGVVTGVSFSAGNVFRIEYDGQFVRYYRNGTLWRQIAAPPGLNLFLDSSFYSPGSVVNGLRFGPLTAASSSTLLVNLNGMQINGNGAVKQAGQGGTNTTWDSCVYSQEGYGSGAFVSFTAVDTVGHMMMGLATNPTASTSYTDINYAIYVSAGTIFVYESGTPYSGFGSYVAGDSFSVTYDGQWVRYWKSGTMFRQVPALPGLKLYLDSSFYEFGAAVKNIQFGQMSNTHQTRGSNLVDASWWSPGVNPLSRWTGNQAGAGAADAFIAATLPDGSSQVVWKATQGAGVQAGGGWDSASSDAANYFPVDTAKAYLFACYFKRTTGTVSTLYFGVTPSIVADMNTTTLNSNPYFGSIVPTLNKWYLVVGWIYPAGSTGNVVGNAGVYDCATGVKLATGLSFNWLAASNGINAATRAYQYYGTAGDVMQIASPSVYLCDGSEPSLDDLLSASAVTVRNPVTATNVSTYIASAAIGTAQVGVLTAGNLTVTALSNTVNGSASSGARVEIAANVVRVYDSAGTIRVKLGDLS